MAHVAIRRVWLSGGIGLPDSDVAKSKKLKPFLPYYRGGEFAAREQEGPALPFALDLPLLSAAQTVLPGSRGGMVI